MKPGAKLLLAAVAVAAFAGQGCILTSAQILTHFALPNPFTIDSATDPTERVLVDLNTIEDYVDNKDKLQGLRDCAILGTFTNVSGPAGGVEAWITPDVTSYTSVAQVQANATLLWGPATIGASGTPEGTKVLNWDESAALLSAAGKAMLISEVKGDGQFTIYTFGTAGVYNIQVDEGLLVLTLDAGQ